MKKAVRLSVIVVFLCLSIIGEAFAGSAKTIYAVNPAKQLITMYKESGGKTSPIVKAYVRYAGYPFDNWTEQFGEVQLNKLVRHGLDYGFTASWRRTVNTEALQVYKINLKTILFNGKTQKWEEIYLRRYSGSPKYATITIRTERNAKGKIITKFYVDGIEKTWNILAEFIALNTKVGRLPFGAISKNY